MRGAWRAASDCVIWLSMAVSDLELDPSDDGRLIEIASAAGVRFVSGGMMEIPKNREISDAAWQAIELLSDEWDYDWRKVDQ